MKELNDWLEIAKYVGAGGAFVLGVVVWKLWNAFNDERIYSRTRDRETLNVMVELTALIKMDAEKDQVREEKVLHAIQELKQTIERHLK